MCVFCKHLIKTHNGRYGVNLKACSEGLYEILVYLIDVLKLRADVLLFPQTLTDAPIGRGKDDFVWARNTATQKQLSCHYVKYGYIIVSLSRKPMKPHPCSMTSAIAATSSSYSTISLSELFAFLLQQKDRDDIHSSAEEKV